MKLVTYDILFILLINGILAHNWLENSGENKALRFPEFLPPRVTEQNFYQRSDSNENKKDSKDDLRGVGLMFILGPSSKSSENLEILKTISFGPKTAALIKDLKDESEKQNLSKEEVSSAFNSVLFGPENSKMAIKKSSKSASTSYAKEWNKDEDLQSTDSLEKKETELPNELKDSYESDSQEETNLTVKDSGHDHVTSNLERPGKKLNFPNKRSNWHHKMNRFPIPSKSYTDIPNYGNVPPLINLFLSTGVLDPSLNLKKIGCNSEKNQNTEERLKNNSNNEVSIPTSDKLETKDKQANEETPAPSEVVLFQSSTENVKDE